VAADSSTIRDAMAAASQFAGMGMPLPTDAGPSFSAGAGGSAGLGAISLFPGVTQDLSRRSPFEGLLPPAPVSDATSQPPVNAAMSQPFAPLDLPAMDSSALPPMDSSALTALGFQTDGDWMSQATFASAFTDTAFPPASSFGADASNQ
jgi:hypothetical protein